MIYQKYIARCYRVYQHERNENASFLSIFNGGGRPKGRFSNFPRFWKNSSALVSFNCIFENNLLKALFGQNMKKLKILKLSPDSRYLQKLALKCSEIDHPQSLFDWIIGDPCLNLPENSISGSIRVNGACTVTEWMCCVVRSTAGHESRVKESAAMRVIFSTLQEQLSSHNCNLKRSHCSALFIGTLSEVCIKD